MSSVASARPSRRVRPVDVPAVALRLGGSARASDAVLAGARDFLVCGPNLEDRVATLLGELQAGFEIAERKRRLGEQNARLRRGLEARFQIVGESPRIRRALDQARRVAAIPRSVRIEGERGTGKELEAHAIHLARGADVGPMVTVNCAAFAEPLLEREPFGHERGAFTGADRAPPGRFEPADHGTLFRDEIAHMSAAFQQRILRVVEDGTYPRVGGVRELRSTARIIAATNVDLVERMRDGRFLSDLYVRLAFGVIVMPPLGEREGDVALFARHVLDPFSRAIPALGGKRLSDAAIRALERHSFPGNVRELKNGIERAACRDITNEIAPEDLGLDGPRAPDLAGGARSRWTRSRAGRSSARSAGPTGTGRRPPGRSGLRTPSSATTSRGTASADRVRPPRAPDPDRPAARREGERLSGASRHAARFGRGRFVRRRSSAHVVLRRRHASRRRDGTGVSGGPVSFARADPGDRRSRGWRPARRAG